MTAQEPSHLRISSQPDEGRIVIEGDLARGNAAAVADMDITAGVEALILDLEGAEVGDGAAAVVLVELVRKMLDRADQVLVRGAPQLLAHNLYRVGLLNEPRLRLEGMREDEPYG